MKRRAKYQDPDLLVYVLRHRRPRLMGHLFGWIGAAVLWALLGFVLPDGIAFTMVCACGVMGGLTVLRIVRVNRKLEELE